MVGFGSLMTRKRQWMATQRNGLNETADAHERLLMLMRDCWCSWGTADAHERPLMLMRDRWCSWETADAHERLLMLMKDCWWPRETTGCRRKLEISRLLMASTILVEDSDLMDCLRSWETADGQYDTCWRRWLEGLPTVMRDCWWL